MSKSVLIRTYRLGNVEVELRRSFSGKKGRIDFFRISRYYIKADTKEVQKTGTLLKEDLRDLSVLLLKLNSMHVEIEEVEHTKII